MRNVVSLALFGDPSNRDGSGQNYHNYLASFVLAHHNIFPRSKGWELHLFVDNHESRAVSLARRLQKYGLIRVQEMGPAIKTKAMLWRLQPVFEDGVDYVFARDIDHCPMPRDRAVCEVFIQSNCAVHTVHDAEAHVGVMGGLCGFQAEPFKNVTGLSSLADLYERANKSADAWARHGTDQDVLNKLCDDVEELTLLEHRYDGWKAGPNVLPPHGNGAYGCTAFSTAMPNIGKSTLPPKLREEADRLANHLGAAGYDIAKARRFWETYGDEEVTRIVHECEAAILEQVVNG